MTKRCFIVVIVVSAFASGQPLELSVRLEGGGHLKASTLKASTLIASHLLATAGLKTLWTESRPADIRFEVVGRHPEGINQLAMGYTGTAPFSAGAVTLLIKAVAERMQMEESVVLGSVIAHEIGHLFGLRDAVAGVMASEFTLKDYQMAAQGSLRFTAAEAERLRHGVRTLRQPRQ